MNFAFISLMDDSPWGGSEDLWSQTACHLVADGHQVIASVKDWGSREAAELHRLESAGVRVLRRTPPPPQRLHQQVAARILTRLGRRPTAQNSLAAIASMQPDLVMFSLGGGFPSLRDCGILTARGIPFAILIQAASEHLWPTDDWRIETLESFRRACAVFFVSTGNRNLVARQLAWEHPVTEVVRNPFRVPYDTDPSWPDPSVPLRLAFVGRLDPPAKGCDLLLEVVALPAWRNRPVEVVFFGTGFAAGGMDALARRHGLSNVRFAGHCADVTSIWREHHILVLPSRYEGLPLTIVEAMLCGRPCIVTDVAGNAELIENNVTGFVAAAPTIPHLAEAMERAWAARADWPVMGARAAEAVRRQIPPNPARIFADRLLQLARSRP